MILLFIDTYCNGMFESMKQLLLCHFLLKYLYQGRKVSCHLHVLLGGINVAPVSAILLLYFGTFLTVWNCLFSILLCHLYHDFIRHNHPYPTWLLPWCFCCLIAYMIWALHRCSPCLVLKDVSIILNDIGFVFPTYNKQYIWTCKMSY